jgi:hypothetical protein
VREVACLGAILVAIVGLVAATILLRIAPLLSAIIVAITARRTTLIATATASLVAPAAPPPAIVAPTPSTLLAPPALLAPTLLAPTTLLAPVALLAPTPCFAPATLLAPVAALVWAGASVLAAASGSFVDGRTFLSIARLCSRSSSASTVVACDAAHQRFDLRWAAGLCLRFVSSLGLGRHFDAQLAGNVAPVGGRARFLGRSRF